MTATDPSGAPSGRLGIAAMLVVWAAVLGRTLGLASADQWSWYIAGYSAFVLILALTVLRRPLPAPVLHVCMAAQVAIVLVMLGIDPDRDFVTILFVLQCYQAAVIFPALARTAWVVALVCLTGGSLVLELGLVRGLALGFIPMAAGIVLAMFVVANRELDEQRAAAERIVADLREAQSRLREYAGQADELAALEQRARVAGDLNESVSATLAAAVKAAAAARATLDEPEVALPSLERLQELTRQALAQMRRIIAELRPTSS